MTDAPNGPMTGIRILDLSHVVAGPLATQMLAEQGADVIKVEPFEGELLRLVRPGGFTPLYVNDNRAKRSIALDASQPDGLDIVLELARSSDVFVENFRPGVAGRLGLDEAAVRAVAPDVIYASITGFGPTGPYSDRPCLDPVIQGLTGMVTGQSSGDLPFPDLVRTLVADKTTAYTVAQAITAALFARDRGAGGQHLELSMLDATLAWFWPDGMSDLTVPDDPAPGRRASDTYRLTDAADGQIIYYVASSEQICGIWRALDRPDMAADSRYNHIGLSADRDALLHVGTVISEEVAKLSTADVITRFARESVPAGPILERDDVLTDPQVVHNAIIEEWDHPAIGRLRQAGPAVKFHGTPTSLVRRIDAVGQSSAEILRELGRDDADIATLVAAGIVNAP